MSSINRILLIMCILIALLSIGYAVGTFIGLVWFNKPKSPYDQIGKRVVIQGDTLVIWKYLPATKQYILNNGEKITLGR